MHFPTFSSSEQSNLIVFGLITQTDVINMMLPEDFQYSLQWALPPGPAIFQNHINSSHSVFSSFINVTFLCHNNNRVKRYFLKMLKSQCLYKYKMKSYHRFYNLLMIERPRKAFQSAQRKVQRIGTYIGSQECWNEFTQSCKISQYPQCNNFLSPSQESFALLLASYDF